MSQVPLQSTSGKTSAAATGCCRVCRLGEREFFIDNLHVRIHYIIVIIMFTGLAP